MHEAALALPEQVADAAASVEHGIEGLPDRDRVSHVLAIGMGGSGIAGDVLSVVAGPFVPVPIAISKDYELPGYVGERTLVFAISFSGNSEETIEAATEAAALGAHVVAVTAGGELARLAGEWGRPVLRIPPGIPMPRAGLGAARGSAAARARADGTVPRRAGLGASGDRAADTTPRSARRSGQSGRGARHSDRAHHPPRVWSRADRRSCGDAVEVRREREREGAVVLQPGPRALSQRDRGVGSARRRDAPGVHGREPPH